MTNEYVCEHSEQYIAEVVEKNKTQTKITIFLDNSKM